MGRLLPDYGDKAHIEGLSPRQLHVFDDPRRGDRGWVRSALMYQAAANQTVNGVRVSWKIVPAVRETRLRQPPQRQIRPRATVVTVRPHAGHTGPPGQRSQSR